MYREGGRKKVSRTFCLYTMHGECVWLFAVCSRAEGCDMIFEGRVS